MSNRICLKKLLFSWWSQLFLNFTLITLDAFFSARWFLSCVVLRKSGNLPLCTVFNRLQEVLKGILKICKKMYKFSRVEKCPLNFTLQKVWAKKATLVYWKGPAGIGDYIDHNHNRNKSKNCQVFFVPFFHIKCCKLSRNHIFGPLIF